MEEYYNSLDIEELFINGFRSAICPLYHEKKKNSKTDLVFLPYNFNFDQKNRDALQINLKESITILLIDTSHNIFHSPVDAKTFELSFQSIDVSKSEKKSLKENTGNKTKNNPEMK